VVSHHNAFPFDTLKLASGSFHWFKCLSGIAAARARITSPSSIPPPRKKIRLKGGLYRVDGFNPRDSATIGQRTYGIADPAQADQFAAKLERLSAIRAAYHRQRYGRDEVERQPLPRKRWRHMPSAS
jgi:hypothetical protein